MEEATQRIIDAMHSLIEANRHVRAVLTDAEEILHAGIAHLESGVDVMTALRMAPTSAQRHSTQEALEQARAARHELRLQVMAVCFDDGMTPREIAEQWGISRQRADRMVQEIKRHHDEPHLAAAPMADASGGGDPE